jgi:16S rRNA (uracil1498-N3)-methyltransferase
MTRRRWIADEVSGDRALIFGEHAAHLSRVLRVRVGQQFDVVTPLCVRRGQIVVVNDDRVEFTLGDAIAESAVAPVTILLSIFKFDRMEWAIEKCTELGVTRIVPVISRRTEPHLASAAEKRVERWQRIAKQASEQARRSFVPEISAPVKLPLQMKDKTEINDELCIVLSENERDVLLRDLLKEPTSGLLLALGPEGGWAEEELALFAQRGWKSASLGNTILRAETAAIAATAIALSELQ